MGLGGAEPPVPLLQPGEQLDELALAGDQAGEPVPEVQGGPDRRQDDAEEAAGDQIRDLLEQPSGMGGAEPAGDMPPTRASCVAD